VILVDPAIGATPFDEAERSVIALNLKDSITLFFFQMQINDNWSGCQKINLKMVIFYENDEEITKNELKIIFYKFYLKSGIYYLLL